MSTPAPPPPRFEIVPRGTRRLAWWLALALFAAGLLLGGGVAWWWRAPPAGSPEARLAEAERALAAARAQVDELEQRVTTLTRSDQISREANQDMQETLAQKEDEIASLRADLAFYERFVGSEGERRPLGVHSVEFAPEAGGSWRYEVVLTQSLNRGAISRGQMRFSVEGVRDGRLTTVNWDELHQNPDAPGQDYAFRYFQRLGGSVILPAGFTPQRVTVTLRGGGANLAQTFAWTLKDTPGEP
ncbi:DUF6776 family protein [Vulcaniibacterium gelatinicum]|uniref:DUF6776 family protein n=1 Tax=Vulcaniibacterium gelatinicum TaxID=2598725 RepID=UPI0011CC70AC|nr:DUF6776 family protein [Vulcaniibacterium gelatinicum]